MRIGYVDGKKVEGDITIPAEKKIINAIRKMIWFRHRDANLYIFWRNVYKRYTTMETGSALGRTL